VNAEVKIDFIAGMARSGTTWLGRTLAAHPDVAVFGESSFFGRLYVPPRADGRYGAEELERVRAIQREQEWSATTGDASGCLMRTRAADYAALVDASFRGMQAPVTPAEAFRSLASAIAESEGKPRALEKTPHHVHWLERIAASVPDARFVLLTRDPYGFMLSLEHLGDRIDDRRRRTLDRAWRHPLLAALAWRGYMLSVERAVERYGDRILVVDSRELRRRPNELLVSVQSFLGLEVHDLAHAAGENSSFGAGGRPGLGGQDVLWMNLVAGRVMRRNGYPVARVPVRPGRVLISLLTLPLSLAYVSVALPRRVPGSFRSYLAGWLGR
jgi:hypothetical protein